MVDYTPYTDRTTRNKRNPNLEERAYAEAQVDEQVKKVLKQFLQNELHGSHPQTGLKLSYKGFPVDRLPPFCLFEITPREGCDLPPMLVGKYTKLDTLKGQIDRYLNEVPTATAETAYIERPPKKRGRGRPPKKVDGTTEPAKLIDATCRVWKRLQHDNFRGGPRL
jgi:hypothetical protein